MSTRHQVLYRVALVFVAGLLLGGCSGVARVLSPYGATYGVNGERRPAGQHAGVDFDGVLGSPVLAPADALVASVNHFVSPWSGPCGKSVLLKHKAGETVYYTVFCHLDKVTVRMDQEVKRGEEIGKIGTTGDAKGIPHVHVEVCNLPCREGHADGDPKIAKETLDPLRFIVGCFDPTSGEEYAALAKNGGTPRLVLTYPVPCPPAKKKERRAELDTIAPAPSGWRAHF